MKTKMDLLVWGMVLAMPFGVSAALVVPGADDSDGALHVTEDTVIDLALAATGAWDDATGTLVSYATLAAADPERDEADFVGKGVYEPDKWAVIFRYSSVTVDEGATLTFKNHAKRAPVVWLVSGDVTVNGVVSLDGQGFLDSPDLSTPGPGGFRGAWLTLRPGLRTRPDWGLEVDPSSRPSRVMVGVLARWGAVGQRRMETRRSFR